MAPIAGTPRTGPAALVVLAALCLLLGGSRAAMVWAPSVPLVNHLELHHGAVALELLRGPALPPWEYQAPAYYGGSTLVCALLAGAFALLGPTVFATKILAFAILALTLVLLFLACQRSLGLGAATVVGLLFVFPPWEFQRITLILYGAREQAALFLAVDLLLLLRWTRTGARTAGIPFALGVCGGLGFWFIYDLGLAIPVMGLFVFAGAGWRPWRRPVLAFLGGGLVGILPWAAYNLALDGRGLYIHGEPLWLNFHLDPARWLNYRGETGPSDAWLPTFGTKLLVFFTVNLRASLENCPAWLMGPFDLLPPPRRASHRDLLVPDAIGRDLYLAGFLVGLAWLWGSTLFHLARRRGSTFAARILDPARVPATFSAVFLVFYVVVFSASNFMHDGYFALIFPLLYVAVGTFVAEAWRLPRTSMRIVTGGTGILVVLVLLVFGIKATANLVDPRYARDPLHDRGWDYGFLAFKVFRMPLDEQGDRSVEEFLAFSSRFPEDVQDELWTGWGMYVLEHDRERVHAGTLDRAPRMVGVPPERRAAVWEGLGYAVGCGGTGDRAPEDLLGGVPDAVRAAFLRGVARSAATQRRGDVLSRLRARVRGGVGGLDPSGSLAAAVEEGAARGADYAPIFGLIVDHVLPGRPGAMTTDPREAVPAGHSPLDAGPGSDRPIYVPEGR